MTPPVKSIARAKWMCVKCWGRGKVTGTVELAPQDARPRWRKFTTLIVCPACGDDKGHAGIIESPLTESIPESLQCVHYEPPNKIELWSANESIKEIVFALTKQDEEVAIARIAEKRAIPIDFAAHLYSKGTRVGTIAEIRLKVSAQTMSLLKMPRQVTDTTELIVLPFTYIDDTGKRFYHQIQFRVVDGESDASLRYITTRFAQKTPLVHFALPTIDPTERPRRIWVAEGYFKAEAIAHYLQEPAIATSGLPNPRWMIVEAMRALKKLTRQESLFAGSVVLAPDSDARAKVEVARAFWELAKALENEGIEVAFAVWTRERKGIDDALVANERVDIVATEVWLATLSKQVIDTILQVRLKTRVLIDGELAQAIELPTSVEPTAEDISDRYQTERMKEEWLEGVKVAVTETKGRKAGVVVDMSATGTGKTHTAATLKPSDFRRKGIYCKRVVYIAPEVKRAAVAGLEKWALFEGRDQRCGYYGRLQKVEEEGLTNVGRRVCASCPLRKTCPYYTQKPARRTKVRVSFQSYSPREGDIVILDEFTRLQIWRTWTVTVREVKELVTTMDRLGGNEKVRKAFEQIGELMKRKEASHNEISKLFEGLMQHEVDNFLYEAERVYADIREIRAWVFGKRETKPTTLFWAKHLVEAVTGRAIGQVWIEKGMLKVKVMDSKLKGMTEKCSAILILDAEADTAEIRKIFPTTVIPMRSDLPEATPLVYQMPLVTVTHRARKEVKEKAHRLAKVAIKAMQEKGILPKKARIGVITHKDAAEVASRVWGRKTVIGWWGRDERETNVYYERECNILVCVGLPHRNIGEIAAERLKAGYKERVFRKAKLDRQGQFWTILKEFADEDLAKAVRREVAVAYRQAAGRLRQNRREEQCYMVVFDTEPLPQRLNPTVLPPDQVLPPQAMQELRRHRERGMAVVNELKRKVMTEKIAKLAEAYGVYVTLVGENPSQHWLAKATGLTRRTVGRLLGETEMNGKERKTRKEKTETKQVSRCDKTGHTFAYKELIPKSLLFIYECVARYVTPHLAIAVGIFIAKGYPVPYRALARRCGVHPQTVLRVARRMRKWLEEQAKQREEAKKAAQTQEQAQETQEPIAPKAPQCPNCAEPLQPDHAGKAVCVGCGRVWVCVGEHAISDEALSALNEPDLTRKPPRDKSTPDKLQGHWRAPPAWQVWSERTKQPRNGDG